MVKIKLNRKPFHNELILSQRGNETPVLLNLENSKYYTFDGIGGRIWELSDGNRTVSDIITIITEEYDAPLETIESDTIEFLKNLTHEKIMEYAK